MAQDTTGTFTKGQIFDLAFDCLHRNGCDDENARAIADNIARAELDGCASHGLFRLPGYVAALRSEKVDGAARPHTAVSQKAPSVLKVDAAGGFAPLALEVARPELISLTKKMGIAAIGVVHVHHFSALWADVEPLAEAGLVALACTAYLPAVAPVGSSTPFFGTNPMAFAWPRKGKPPMVIDQSSAAMARGEVMIAARDGKDVPEGVGLDTDGQPTTDPAKVLEGVMLPFGGHKGSAIALIVELLAAGLIGESFSVEAKERDNADGGPPRGGMFMMAINPDMFGDESWDAHSNTFLTKLENLDGVRLPGQRRIANRTNNAEHGIRVKQELLDTIRSLPSLE
ncbi:Ldh family oxidoreductase [Loktanella sp. Alg231-35]|uniref:Ldh family oxidoreductase n=1 Tax=Loktanella sp. Alg231-35 TaxID=1922220 RepID=UPI000D55C69F|nr:Ldh family oxidoreductase [Loktanella sp. Alg231-35]